MSLIHCLLNSRASLRIVAASAFIISACGCARFASSEEALPQSEPPRPTRADSYFGVHFDFHAGTDNKDIGANTTPEMVQTIIDRLHPDFIQVDSKGHPGWSSYPTKVGATAPGVVADSLKIWREVTAKNGVALYTHYSGVWDAAAMSEHPEWAAVDKNGVSSKECASVFGDYRKERLEPQLLEFALDYKLDGVWVDGECWATVIDYSDAAKNAFRKATGRETIPTAPGQDGWLEWCDFHRQAFRNYLAAYVETVKSQAPDYQIASNWAFTDHMAEPVSAKVDFISGDYSPNNSVNAARYSARLMANQGIPWDLMAWSFANDPQNGGGWSQKTGVQLCREAACVLALGGAFQAYVTQNSDGSVNLAKLDGLEEASRFCQARRQWCKRSLRVPQVALYCPTADHYRQTSQQGESLFPMLQWQRAILNRLLEANYSVDVLIDSALVQDLEQFPVVVFYRCRDLSDALKTKLAAYVAQGGAVVGIGNELSETFDEIFKDAVSLGKTDGKKESIDVSFYKLGKGIIARIPTPSTGVEDFNVPVGGDFERALANAMETAFPFPIVRLDARLPLDVSVRKTTGGELTIHFVNVSGNHEAAGIIESIEPVVNASCKLKLDEKPSSLRLEPSGIDLPFTWKEGIAETTIPSIPIHEIIVAR